MSQGGISMKKFIAYVLFFLSVVAVDAQDRADSTKIYFEIGHRQFNPRLGDNGRSMDHFVNSVRKAQSEDDVDHILIRAFASPDGQNAANERLTRYRCEEVTNYIVKATGIEPGVVKAVPEGIAWEELRNLVDRTPEVPNRETVLDILDNTPVWVYDDQGKIIDSRKKQLMQLAGGAPYRWMFTNLFPQLRNAVAVSLFLKSDIRAARDAAVAAARAAADAAVAASNAARAAAEASQAASEATSDIAEAIKAAQEAAEKAARAAEEAKAAADRAQIAAGQAVKASEEAAATDEVPVARSKAREAEDARMVAESAKAAAEASLSAAQAAQAAAEAIALAQQPKNSEASKASENSELSEHSEFSENHIPRHLFALKTNIIYDALLMPNLEFEWLFNDRWSVALEADVAWWSNDSRHKYYQLFMVSPEVRRWFRTRGPWHGMYVGVFAGGGKYDLENGDKGYHGEGGMAGVSFGYMWPITRCLSLEAAVGAGYLYTRYKEYIPYDGHYLYQRTKSLNYFGPLKLKFSIAWRFNDINKPTKVNPAI